MITAKLSSCAFPRTERTSPIDEPNAIYVGLESINPNSIRLGKTYSAQEFSSAGFRFFPGDILYSRLRPYLNKVAIPGFSGMASGEFIVLRTSSYIFPKYLLLLLHSKAFVDFACSKTKGDRPRITFEQFADFELLLPPLPEQRAIAAKIEAIFSEFDKGVESLEAAKAKLKVYRRAVLKAAFEGNLTKEWREVNNQDSDQIDITTGYPVSWSSSSCVEFFDSISNGFSGKPDDQGDFEILRISAVRSLSLDITDTRKMLNRLTNDYEISENDILFTRYNGSKLYTGVCARVGGLDRKLFYPDKIIRCRKAAITEDEAKYLEYVFASPKIRGEIEKRIKTTAGQHGISGRDIKTLFIPIPSMAEQSQIVSEIESRLSLADKLEAAIDEGLAKAESLRQAILKKAFEGRLLSEAELEAAKREPDWESAEALLERIKAESKDKGKGIPKRGRKKHE